MFFGRRLDFTFVPEDLTTSSLPMVMTLNPRYRSALILHSSLMYERLTHEWLAASSRSRLMPGICVNTRV